jgi:hypothetical protein
MIKKQFENKNNNMEKNNRISETGGHSLDNKSDPVSKKKKINICTNLGIILITCSNNRKENEIKYLMVRIEHEQRKGFHQSLHLTL